MSKKNKKRPSLLAVLGVSKTKLASILKLKEEELDLRKVRAMIKEEGARKGPDARFKCVRCGKHGHFQYFVGNFGPVGKICAGQIVNGVAYRGNGRRKK